ncbi:MAG: pitrilysin family protein [Pseudomonadota bacterium]
MSVELHRLSNGLRIVTEAMPSLQSAAVGLWVDAGGRHETPEQNGIAHFLEHMAFKGTARRSALQIAEEIEDVGGYINAYTSRETTAYYARVLGHDVPLALDVIADIVLNPALPEAEIEVERGVILQEIGQALDTPDDIVFDWLQEAAFPNQALGRTILGPVERVRAFTQADLARFVAEHYGPDQLVLAAAGAVDHTKIVAQAERLFGHLASHAHGPAEGATFQGGEKRVVKPLEQVHLTLALEGPGYTSSDLYAAQIYATLLGGGMSSRLFQEAREKRGLCYSVFASAGSYADTGMLTFYAGTGAEDVGALAELMVDEVRRVALDASQAEVARARAQMKAGLLMGLESPSSRAERMARTLAIWGRVPTLAETVDKIEAVDRAALIAFAEELAAQGQLALALIGPGERVPSLAELQERLAA